MCLGVCVLLCEMLWPTQKISGVAKYFCVWKNKKIINKMILTIVTMMPRYANMRTAGKRCLQTNEPGTCRRG